MPNKCFVIGPMRGKNAMVLDWLAHKVVKPLLPPDFQVATPEATEPGNIMTHVIRSCDRAQLVVANVTGNNPNVLYEIAVLDALGRACIPVKIVSPCNKEPDAMPFDRAAYRYIEISSSVAERRTTRRRMKQAIEDTLAIQARGDLFQNPLTDYYGVPLSHFSSAYALARGYFVNLVAEAVKGIDRGEVIDSKYTSDAGRKVLQIVIPDRVMQASRTSVRQAVESGRCREVKVAASGRCVSLYEWTKQTPGLHCWMDVPTTMFALHETIVNRLGRDAIRDQNNPEYREVEQDEIAQFERFFRKVMSDSVLASGGLPTEMVEVIRWSASPLA